MLLLFFLGVAIACFTITLLLLKPSGSTERVHQRLLAVRRMRQSTKAQDDPELEAADEAWQKRLEARILATSAGQNLTRLLLQSRSDRTLPGFLGRSALLGVTLGLVAGVACKSALAGLAGAAFGSCLYTVGLRIRRNRRVDRFAQQLPATAAMMSRALRAGHSVAQMLELAADQAKDPLREDFAQLSREQRLGMPLRDALLSLSSRVPVPDLQFLVTAMLIQKETGGDLVQILERTATLIEERLRIRRQIQTFTAQGRMSAWVLTALPIILLLLLSFAVPGYAKTLFQDPTGQHMLLVGLVLLIVGGYLIRRIVNIEV